MNAIPFIHQHLLQENRRTGCEGYWPRCARAFRIGALEMWITPSNGWSSSRIRKIAPDTDSAANNSEVMAIVLDGANRPQLVKMIASHEITTISRGGEIDVPDCSNNSQRN